eukprot:COSAG04_NODE_11604_length_699_cov_1.090000_2_plen_76_part_01
MPSDRVDAKNAAKAAKACDAADRDTVRQCIAHRRLASGKSSLRALRRSLSASSAATMLALASLALASFSAPRSSVA